MTKPTDSKGQGSLPDVWQTLAGPLAGGSSRRLGQAEIRQVRQIVSALFGPDARIFIREKTSGEDAGTVHIMVMCARALHDRHVARTALIERFRDPLEGRRSRVLLLDPTVTPTEEHKRFRFAAMEY
ncbi:MAG: hypothetical protein WCT47_18260 [Betaproteobacteria bacterium]